MFKRTKIIFKMIFAFLVGGSQLFFAGETGKIAGKIIDQSTGEPLIAANVMIVSQWVNDESQPIENLMGASTDGDGEYFILNIPPGDYSVKASYIGFKPEIMTHVRVDVDKTTTVDFKISPEAFETDEVTITAFSPKTVEPDVTATKQSYHIKDLESIAGVANIEDVLALQADVVDDHFRGGRVGEALYLIGGGTIVNPLSNRKAFNPIVTGLQQVEVYTSGFSAEYGNAQSGVVNMVAKEGGNQWETQLEIAAIPPYYKTWNGSPYSEDNLLFYEILKNTEAWLEENPTQPGRSLFDAGYGFGPLYLPPRNTWPPDPLTLKDSLHIARLGQALWLQSIRDVGMEYDNTVDYRFDFSVGGPISNDLKVFISGRQNIENPVVPTAADDTERQIMSNLTYQAGNDDKFTLRFVYDYQFENLFNSNWERWLFDRTFSVSKYIQNSKQYGLSWNHIFTNATFMNVHLNVLDVLSRERIELLRDDQFLEFYSNQTNWVDYTGPSYHRVGRLTDDRGDERIFTYDFNGNLTTQINKNNLVKAGLQFSYYDVDVDQDMNVTNEGSYRRVDFTAYPYEGGIYLQDKMEFQGFIANIGLRYDFYDFNLNYYSDIFSPLRNPDYDETLPYLERGQYYDRDAAKKEKTKIYSRIQPRIGLSFPLSETSVFHLNYGTFTQRPSFDQIFYSQVTMFNEIEILGNPRLKPENTKAYDVGLVQALPFGIKVDVSAYYKDVTNLIESAYYYDEQQSVYRTYINRDYADIKGFHFSVEKNTGPLRGYVRYNYESATGKSSNALDAPVTYFENPAEGQEFVDLPDPEDVYLNYDRTHKAVFNIRYLTPKQSGFKIGNFYPFGNFSVSATFRVYSGRPFTFDETGQGLKFNQRTPTEKNLRLRVEKRFAIGQSTFSVYGEGFNLLEQKVYHYSRTFDDERNTARWMNDNENILVYDEYAPYVTRQDVYLIDNLPRHFRVGIKFNF